MILLPIRTRRREVPAQPMPAVQPPGFASQIHLLALTLRLRRKVSSRGNVYGVRHRVLTHPAKDVSSLRDLFQHFADSENSLSSQSFHGFFNSCKIDAESQDARRLSVFSS